jgi:hypothetical protein
MTWSPDLITYQAVANPGLLKSPPGYSDALSTGLAAKTGSIGLLAFGTFTKLRQFETDPLCRDRSRSRSLPSLFP